MFNVLMVDLKLLVAMKLIIKFPSQQLWYLTKVNKLTSHELIPFYQTAGENQLITNQSNHKTNYCQTCRFIHYLSGLLLILHRQTDRVLLCSH